MNHVQAKDLLQLQEGAGAQDVEARGPKRAVKEGERMDGEPLAKSPRMDGEEAMEIGEENEEEMAMEVDEPEDGKKDEEKKDGELKDVEKEDAEKEIAEKDVEMDAEEKKNEEKKDDEKKAEEKKEEEKKKDTSRFLQRRKAREEHVDAPATKLSKTSSSLQSLAEEDEEEEESEAEMAASDSDQPGPSRRRPSEYEVPQRKRKGPGLTLKEKHDRARSGLKKSLKAVAAKIKPIEEVSENPLQMGEELVIPGQIEIARNEVLEEEVAIVMEEVLVEVTERAEVRETVDGIVNEVVVEEGRLRDVGERNELVEPVEPNNLGNVVGVDAEVEIGDVEAVAVPASLDDDANYDRKIKRMEDMLEEGFLHILNNPIGKEVLDIVLSMRRCKTTLTRFKKEKGSSGNLRALYARIRTAVRKLEGDEEYWRLKDLRDGQY